MVNRSRLGDGDLRRWTNYLHERPQILGWFHPPDPLLFAMILYHQIERGVEGDILEIGTYAGKSAVLLGFGLRPDETLHVCDPFVIPHLASDPQQVVAQFLSTYKRFHSAAPDVFVGLSHHLRLQGKSCRFVHIDGGHRFSIVAHDIQLARDLVVPGSVIAIDDYSNSKFPGIAAAVGAAVERCELTPFCLSPQKLYATIEPDGAGEWREAIVAALAADRGVQTAREEIAGSEVVLTIPLPSAGHRIVREIVPPLVRRLRRSPKGIQRPPYE